MIKTEDSNLKGLVIIGLPSTLPIKGNAIAFFFHCYSIPFQNASSPYKTLSQ